MELFDSHAHYNDEQFSSDQNEILKQIYENGITSVVCAGYDLPSSQKAVQLAKQYNYVYATCGISPNDIPKFPNEEQDVEDFFFEDILKEQITEIHKLAKNNKVVAIGEIGLDYYWNKENKEQQKQAFKKQIELANLLNLPIVIHTREALQDTLDILKNEISPAKKGVFHCCPLNVELIAQALKLGFYISFAGPVTFKNAKNAESAIQLVPLDKILIETDSPYLAPEPNRGTRNNSTNLKYIAEKIAKVKGKTIEEIAQLTYQNTKNIFNIM